MMTRDEFAQEVRRTFEIAEATWMGEVRDKRVSKVIFYLSALRKVKSEPFDLDNVHGEIVGILEEKLNKAFEKITIQEYDRIFMAMKEAGRHA